MTPGTLNYEIQRFYDVSSELWENTWGQHMHLIRGYRSGLIRFGILHGEKI